VPIAIDIVAFAAAAAERQIGIVVAKWRRHAVAAEWRQWRHTVAVARQ